jgi:hypothetical protein
MVRLLHDQHGREWQALVDMLTEERLSRLDMDAIRQAVEDEQASHYETTTFPFRLKTEDSAPDASQSLPERQERRQYG